jgi:hypothetical protein
MEGGRKETAGRQERKVDSPMYVKIVEEGTFREIHESKHVETEYRGRPDAQVELFLVLDDRVELNLWNRSEGSPNVDVYIMNDSGQTIDTIRN